MIFYCNGGYGHRAAAAAISPLLEKEYELQLVNPFTDILESLDFAKKITRHDCDQVYNYLLQKGWIRFMNFYCKNIVGPNIRILSNKMQKLFDRFFLQHAPDMIISLIPVVNLPASNAAKNHNIPYVMVTLDHDTTLWETGLKRLKHDNITVFVHNKERAQAFEQSIKTITQKRIIPAGFPVRQEFSLYQTITKEQREELKKSWSVPCDKPIALLMMGGVGGRQTKAYVRQLIHYPDPLHVVVCVGSNEKLLKELQPIIAKRQKNVTFSCIPFTKQVAELFAFSDIIITKPGPGTLEEALTLKVPLLLDKTASLLFWEKNNVDFAVKHSFGQVVTRTRRLNRQIKEMLEPETYKKYKKMLDRYNSPFNQRFLAYIHKTLA